MFNCPSINLKNRKLLDEPVYKDEVEVYNLVPVAKTLIDADGVEYQGVEYEPTFIRKYSMKEYIRSFADDVGIQNILKKLAISGDKTILNQTGREALCPDGGLEPIQDFSEVPSSKAEAFNIVSAGVAAYDNLPADIKGKMSLEQFVKGFGQAQLDAYIESVKAKYEPVKEGGNE